MGGISVSGQKIFVPCQGAPSAISPDAVPTALALQHFGVGPGLRKARIRGHHGKEEMEVVEIDCSDDENCEVVSE